MIVELIFVSSNRWLTFLQGRRSQSPGVIKGILLFLWSSLLSVVFIIRFVLRLRSEARMGTNEPMLSLPKREEAEPRFANHPLASTK